MPSECQFAGAAVGRESGVVAQGHPTTVEFHPGNKVNRRGSQDQLPVSHHWIVKIRHPPGKVFHRGIDPSGSMGRIVLIVFLSRRRLKFFLSPDHFQASFNHFSYNQVT
jgi:hypothetical protein